MRINRDIKPENLLLYNAPGKNLRIKVIDFGGAKIFNKAKCAHIHESFGSVLYIYIYIYLYSPFMYLQK